MTTSPRLTKGMAAALRAIAAGQGYVHKIVANEIEIAGLAVAPATTFKIHVLTPCGQIVEHRFQPASSWLLTAAGAAAIGMEAR